MRVVLISLVLLLACTVVLVQARHNRTQHPIELKEGDYSTQVGSDACGGSDYGTAGQFDFYVYEQSWPAEFCQAHMDWPGCSNPTAWQQVNFTLHGMWPNYNTPQNGHSWPQCCASQYGTDVSATVVHTLLSQLQTYWPNEQDPSGNDLSASLWQHEWQKHGTCSGLPQQPYFTDAMNIEASMPTPALIHNNIGGSVAYTDLQAAFKASGCSPNGACWTGFTCDNSGGSQSLSGIVSCFTPQLQRMTCPAAVLSGGGCSNGQIGITSF